ncbi:MAG: sigma-70 family RNA polymerase sigma factor [Chloroflexi bacterium]|nr:sigma-70 family RNA polymerase sigma factor [Chloroflexota bacterium]
MSTSAQTGKESGAVAVVFAELYEQYLPKVFRYISYRVRDTALAEDLTSSVFEKALSKMSSYRTDKASLATWLLAIARHQVIDHYRVSSKRQAVSLEEAADTPSPRTSPEEALIRKEEVQRLHVCLAELSEREQEIISLKFGAEMTNRQISGVLGLSESNVGTILYRAVGKLRDRFRE